MRELTLSQKLMVEAGFPPELFLTSEERRAWWKGRKLTTPTSAPAAKKIEDPGTAKLRAELEAKANAKAKAAQADRKERAAIRAKQKLKPQPAAEAAQESDMSKKATAAAKNGRAKKAAKHVGAKHGANGEARKPKAAKAAASTNARTPVNEVVQKIAAMMRRKSGASMQEMVAATGVEPHPMRAKIKQVRDKLGLKTEAPSKENGGRYFIRDGAEPAATEA